MSEGKRRRRGPRRGRRKAAASETAQNLTGENLGHAQSASPPAPANGVAAVRPANAARPERFAAIDLGTNNCRLLVAAPRGRKFRIVDAYSRIVRLGEGLAQSGALSDAAMARAEQALIVCAEKIAKRGATRQRCIATQACRAASNGAEFLERITEKTGLIFEIIAPEEEARLAVRGCAELIDPAAPAGLVFDIGGGSTEMSWIRPREGREPEIAAWLSLPLGVVNISERWGGRDVSPETFEKIVEDVRAEIRAFGDPAGIREDYLRDGAHLVGTSGTVTSIAGVHLALPRYRRDMVDGLWLTRAEARDVTMRLVEMDFAARAAEPCIGVERADLVICGCAILEALIREWPAERIRVGDRGLREGMLADLSQAARRDRRRATGARR